MHSFCMCAFFSCCAAKKRSVFLVLFICVEVGAFFSLALERLSALEWDDESASGRCCVNISGRESTQSAG